MPNVLNAIVMKLLLLTATKAAERMTSAHDFDPRMLRLAVQLAHSTGQRRLLLSILALLLSFLRDKNNSGRGIELGAAEPIVLVRCLVRLSRDLMGEEADRCNFLPTLI
jgi:hypothetical protein